MLHNTIAQRQFCWYSPSSRPTSLFRWGQVEVRGSWPSETGEGVVSRVLEEWRKSMSFEYETANKPTQSALYGKRWSQHWSELFRITSQHDLSSILHVQVRLKDAGDSNQHLRLCGLPGFINEDVREMVGREIGGHQSAGRHQCRHDHSVLPQVRARRKDKPTVSVVTAFLQLRHQSQNNDPSINQSGFV